IENAGFVLADFEDGLGRRAVEKMDAAQGPFALHEEAAHAMAREARQVILASRKWKAEKFDEAFAAAGEMTAQSEQALAVLAKCVESNCDGAAIGPQHLVALEEDVALVTIAGWVTAKQNCNRPWRHCPNLTETTRYSSWVSRKQPHTGGV